MAFRWRRRKYELIDFNKLQFDTTITDLLLESKLQWVDYTIVVMKCPYCEEEWKQHKEFPPDRKVRCPNGHLIPFERALKNEKKKFKLIKMNNQDMKQVRIFYDMEAESYDNDYDVPYWRLYNEITWHNIRKFLPKKKNPLILDAGGGTWYWAIKLVKHGYKVVLTDISEKMLKVAKDKIVQEHLLDKIETKIVDIRDMGCFPSNYFDLALAEGDPVSYCLEPKKAISELTRVVKTNTYVIASVDSKYSMLSGMIRRNDFNKIPMFLETSIFETFFKSQAFTPNELKTLFEICGLKVIRIIEKTVLTRSPREQDIITNNFDKILELELKYCDVPSLVGNGEHLEIVAMKQE